MEIPELEYMTYNQFDKENLAKSYHCPVVGRTIFEIDRDGDISHWMNDYTSDGYGRLVRVRFNPENNFLSVWW